MSIQMMPDMAPVQTRLEESFFAQVLRESGDYQVLRKLTELRQWEGLVTEYAMSNPLAMFNPQDHMLQIRGRRETTSDYENRVKFARNLTARVLDSRLEGLAALPVNREIEGGGMVDPAITRNLDLNKVQTITACTGLCGVNSQVDMMTGEMRYQYRPNSSFLPYTDELGRLVALVVYDWPSTANMGSVMDLSRTTRTIWFRDAVYVVRNGEAIPAINLIGEIPWSFYRTKCHPDDWRGVSDLFMVTVNNMSMNFGWTNLMNLMEEQSFAMYFIREERRPGLNDQPSDEAGSGRAVDGHTGPRMVSGNLYGIGKNDDVFSLTPGADVQGITQALETMGKDVLADNYVVDLRQKSEADSGFALTVISSPYLRKMDLERSEFKKGDQDAVEVAHIIRYAALNGTSARRREGFHVKTSWDTTKLTPKSSNEMIEQGKFEEAQGIFDPVEYIMRKYGMNRDDAEARLEQITSDRERFGSPPQLNAPSLEEPDNDETE